MFSLKDSIKTLFTQAFGIKEITRLCDEIGPLFEECSEKGVSILYYLTEVMTLEYGIEITTLTGWMDF
jgi:hypothetical protein